MDAVVLPVHDVNPVRRTPWITYGLIATNVAVFVITPAALSSGEVSADLLCQAQAFYDRYGAIPVEMLSNQQLARVPTGEVAAVQENAVACVLGPPSYQKNPVVSVLTAMFLHGGLLHLLGNMLFLWVFGNNIEDRFGRIRFLLFYLLAGYVAAYGFALADPALNQPLIGASGAVAGTLGAYLVLYPRVPIWGVVPVLFFLPLRLPAWLVLITWFALQGIYSAGYAVGGGGSVAYLAHVIGFGFGALIAAPLRAIKPPKPKPPQSAYIYRREW